MRIGCSLFLLATCLLILPVAAQNLCPADVVSVQSSADTLFVEHGNAERNCCHELVVQFTHDATTIDFYEGAAGESCRCDCCFDLNFSASGFAPGAYTVRLWNESGTVLYGTAEVEIGGAASDPALLATHLGECTGPTASSRTPWGLVKKFYR